MAPVHQLQNIALDGACLRSHPCHICEINWKTCLVYLDDIMVMGKTFEEHLNARSIC